MELKNSDSYRENAKTKDSYQKSAVVEEALNIYRNVPMKLTRTKHH